MNRTLGAAGLAVLVTLGLSSAALAASGVATANVALRAGPSTSYPSVTTIPAGSALKIHGCLEGRNWCDATWRKSRGWLTSRFLQARNRTRRVRVVDAALPIVSFNFNTYWSSHYRHSSFYRNRTRWQHVDVSSRHVRDRSAASHNRKSGHAAVRHQRSEHRAAVRHRRHEPRATVKQRRNEHRPAVKQQREEHRATLDDRNRGHRTVHTQGDGEPRTVKPDESGSENQPAKCTLGNACR